MEMIKGYKNQLAQRFRGIESPNLEFLQFSAAATLSVLLMSWLRIRPLGVLFLGLLGFWIYQTRCHLQVVIPPEVHNKCHLVVERIRAYRQSHPTSFCAITSAGLAALAILGHLISGSTVVLIGLMIAAIISTKFNFKIVKIEPKDFEWSARLRMTETDLDEEFFPEANESNLNVLERAGDLATLSSPTEIEEGDDEEKSDEIPSEFLIEEVPEITEQTTDEENDVLDLLPVVVNKKLDLSQQDKDAMQFKRRHFNVDDISSSSSTSSSAESLSKGLVFPDHTEVDQPSSSSLTRYRNNAQPHNQEASDIIATAVKAQTHALIANSGKIIPNLVSSIVQWSSGATNSNPKAIVPSSDHQYPINQTSAATAAVNQRVVTALDSSDDSDFEMLESDDVN